MNKNRNESKKVSKTELLLGLLIEIVVCLVGLFLIAVMVDADFKYIGLMFFGIMVVYFICRNYFFVSVSSVVIGIRWTKNKFILLKNCIHIIIIYMCIQKLILLKILAAIVINGDMIFMFLKGKWIFNEFFRIECYRTRK